MDAYTYPEGNHENRHGPKGYADYESFRPWVRDEFLFRCVYCLSRETWGKGRFGFTIEHVVAQCVDKGRILDYSNLVYACSTCNHFKGKQPVPDPRRNSLCECVEVANDGTISALNDDGQVLIDVLRLDNAQNTEFRRLIIETTELCREQKQQLYVQWMRYPEDLPDLSALVPPGGNDMAEGIRESCFARRARGELPETY